MNLTIRVGAAPWPPDISECIQQYPENCSHMGGELRTIWQLLTYVGFKVDIVALNTTEDLDEAILYNHADIYGMTAPLEPKSYTLFSATSPFIDHNFALFYKNIQINKADSLTSTLDPNIMFWMAIISIILFGLNQLQHILSHKSRGNIPKELTGNRLAEAGWSLAAVVVCGVYCNGLAIGFYRTDFKAPFASLDDLSDKISSGSCRLLVEPDALILAQRENDFSSRALTKFREVLELGDPYVYLYKNTSDITYIRDVYKTFKSKYGKCIVILDYDVRYRLYGSVLGSKIGMFIPPEFQNYSYVYYYRRNLDPLLDKYIRIAAAAGSHHLYEMNLKTYYDQIYVNKLDTESVEERSLEALNIYFLLDSFYLFLGGLAVSLVVLILEVRFLQCKYLSY